MLAVWDAFSGARNAVGRHPGTRLNGRPQNLARVMAGAYEAHQACSARLRAALELGCALAEALDRKAVRVRWGKPEFEPFTGRLRQAVEELLDRGKTFYTGGSRLRAALDGLATRHVSCDNPQALYFGWRYGLVASLSEGPGVTARDGRRVRRFVDALKAALDAADSLGKQSEHVQKAVREYRRTVGWFEEWVWPDV